MPRRSVTDDEWADEVIRRYVRRRDHVQQRERALADLRAAVGIELEAAMLAMARFGAVARFGASESQARRVYDAAVAWVKEKTAR